MFTYVPLNVQLFTMQCAGSFCKGLEDLESLFLGVLSVEAAILPPEFNREPKKNSKVGAVTCHIEYFVNI